MTPATVPVPRSHSRVEACRPWLDAELRLVAPEVVVCVGALAAGVLLGPKVRVTAHRGRWLDSPVAPRVTVTAHPSAVLRDPEHRREGLAALSADLAFAARDA